MRSRALWSLGVASVACLGACQAVLNFEDFSAAGGPGGGSAGRGGNGSGGSAGRVSGGSGPAAGEAGTPELGTGGDTSAAGGAPSGGGNGGENTRGTTGVACDRTAACDDGLVCLYGYCRPSCEDDTDCGQDSVCLFRTETGGGCRLDAETCSAGSCDNADLVCGIDGTCRIACSAEDSCDSPTQRCIAGTCVSTVGQGAGAWDCAGAADGELACDGKKLSVCNVLGPGLATIHGCPSAALCEASVPDDPSYDAKHPPECVPGCDAGQRYCDGSTLLTCNDQGSGPLDAGEDCASEGLCDASLAADSTTCLEPACASGETRCSGGETDLVAQACSADGTAFEDASVCKGSSTPQCNPGTGACIALDVDATEVSMADYVSWAETVSDPSALAQAHGCAWNDELGPDTTCLGMPGVACTGSSCQSPAVCVDWCDAFAYCQAHGRRLCGRIGGGMTPYDRADDPGTSQWMNACSAGGQYVYSAATTPGADANACAYAGNSSGSYPGGTHALCSPPAPGYAAFHDLSGNVEEWEDSCEAEVTAASASATDACHTRGGSFASAVGKLACAALPSIAHARGDVAPTLGFRCCGD